jgi:hypothetical protein
MNTAHRISISIVIAGALILLGITLSSPSPKAEAQGQFACEYCYDVWVPWHGWQEVCDCEWVEDPEGCNNAF